jgi:hypothetical protein
MSLIQETVQTYLPLRKKITQSGWLSFDAVCCHHNGENLDKKQRGGVIFTEGVSYHCFNCGFKTSWQPGRPLTTKFKKFLEWIDVPNDLITRCVFESLKLKEENTTDRLLDLNPTFFDKPLPRGSKSIKEWINEPPDKLIPILEYLLNRGYTIDDYDWYWTDEEGFDDRIIIPFYYQNRTVGYTSRTIQPHKKYKYISDQQPGYVFNLDNQNWERKFVIVTEGPLDAICVDGVAVMTNEIGKVQKFLISKLNREVIVVPDRDRAGLKMIEQAIEWGWSVSMPDWPLGIKDVSELSKNYGKLYAIWSIFSAKESSSLKIKLGTKKWIS